MILGSHLTLLIGPTVPVPAPFELTEALDSVQVTHNDTARSGFQLTFKVGRSGPLDLVDYPLLENPLLRTFNRVILVVRFNTTVRVLMDGFITRQQLSPGSEPGTGTLVVTGEDVSIMMDLKEKKAEHPSQSESVIASVLLMRYMQYFLLPPIVIPPATLETPSPTVRIPAQHGTDLRYLQELARRFGYVFYVSPGQVPGQNKAYWGPPLRTGVPQPALSVNMGPETNVNSISFTYDALAPTTVVDVIQDSERNSSFPVVALTNTRIPPLVSQSSPLFNLPNVRQSLLSDTSNLTMTRAFARAQAQVDASVDKVVTASGELDALQYGDLLGARGLVDLRGAGFTNNGFYYVQSVTHSIKKGEYKQRFTLTREGVGALTPMVRP
jgi:hypothetical protein